LEHYIYEAGDIDIPPERRPAAERSLTAGDGEVRRWLNKRN